MNDSTKIDLLGDVFELFSLNCEEEIVKNLKSCGAGIKAFLTPSLEADFSLRVYDKNNEECREYFAAALIAAAFLTQKRGLPLSEILFEAPCGNIEVFCTGNGTFQTRIDKCKQLLSSQAEFAGCDVKYNDFFIMKKIRAIHTEDITVFSKSGLSEFVMLGTEFPAAVILSSALDNRLQMHSFRDHSATFVSNLSLWCCAALNEWITARKTIRKFQTAEYGLVLEPSEHSVTVRIDPIIF